MGHRERQAKDRTLQQNKSKSNRQFIHDNPLSGLRVAAGPNDGKETEWENGTYENYSASSESTPLLLVRFFESGYLSLLISQNGVPMSSPVTTNRFSLQPLQELGHGTSVFLRAFHRRPCVCSGVNLRHSAGGFLRCRSSDSPRAKKLPQLSQNKILNGCASVVPRCHRALELFPQSHPSSSVSGQSLHLIWSIPPSYQSRWGGCEQCLVHWFELLWERELLDPRSLFLLLICAANGIHHFCFHIPLNQSWLSLRRFYRPPLLETRSLRGSMVNTLRIWGREPLGILTTGLRLIPATGRVAFGILFDILPRARFCGGISIITGAPARISPVQRESFRKGHQSLTPLGVCRHQC